MANQKKVLLNKYILQSKDIPLIKFSLYKFKNFDFDIATDVYKLNIDKIFEEHKQLFPKEFISSIDDIKLMSWIERRKAPKNRHFVDKILLSFEEDNNPLKYVDISHALSLNDVYWIKSQYTNDKWKDFNLYEHPFDEVLQQVAFTGYSKKVSGVITSPEITSKGALKKCWSNRTDGIYLIKGDDYPRMDGRSQITGEYYAAQVAKVMKIPHIEYDLEMFHHKSGEKELICTCKLFTDENIGYVDAFTYFKHKGIDIDSIDPRQPDVQAKLSKEYGNQAYEDLMVFDSIIGNQDRHFGNFGMLIDNNTGKFIKPAPIFDNGFSLLYGAADQDMKDLDIYVKNYLKCRYLPLNTQAKWFVQKRHVPLLRKLLNFQFKKHPKYNIDEKTLMILNKFIQSRARKIIQLYHEKEKNLKKIKYNDLSR